MCFLMLRLISALQATSKVKIPEGHKAEPMIASFTLPNMNPKSAATSMPPTMNNAIMGSVEVTSWLAAMCNCYMMTVLWNNLAIPVVPVSLTLAVSPAAAVSVFQLTFDL